MNRKFSNETKEKNMTFRELLKTFEKNKGTDIKLKNKYNNDKYSVQVYASGFKGNLVINDKASVNILFHTKEMNCEHDYVEFTPCMDGVCIPGSTVYFTLNDNIMEMQCFIDTDYLLALANYK